MRRIDNYVIIDSMLRLNFEPKYSQDKGEPQGGTGNTAAISDFNKKGSKFKPYQIPQTFIPINPVDFDTSPSIPVEISQIEAMRSD